MKVTVAIVTYNHAKFIAQAIESALKQEVNFDYEIIIGDDSSKDRTVEVVESFERRHPSKIVLLRSQLNLGMSRNFLRILKASRGKYIALLDGDDFWISAQKLSKQAEFLDGHPDYSMVFHNVRVLKGEEGQEESWNHCPPDQRATTTVDDLLLGNYIASPSVMFRKDLLSDLPAWTHTLGLLDWPLYILTARYGPIGYLKEVMSAYRLHPGGTFSQKSSTWQLEQFVKMYDYLETPLGPGHAKAIRAARFRCWYSLFIEYQKADSDQDARRYGLKCLTSRPFHRYIQYRGKLLLRMYTPRFFNLTSQLWRNARVEKRNVMDRGHLG
jgi:glycosyltransferase involved in cell wall biosynthesis